MNHYRLRRASILTVGISLALFAGLARVNAAVIFVKADATGANDGSSWEDAFADLQDALAAPMDGDDIWVARGTYRPTERNGDRYLSHSLPDRVALFGGFFWRRDRPQSA